MPRQHSCFLAVVFLVAAIGGPARAQLPVIPGAVGPGITTPAGRGGAVYKVTNLASSGVGSLAACIVGNSQPIEPRVCVFEVSGAIHLQRDLVVRKPYLTIAGQTAPPPGITLRGGGLVIVADHVLVQHLRVRPGDLAVGPAPDNRDGIAIGGSSHVVIDHCSVSWSLDGNLDLWDDVNLIEDVTIRRTLLSEALYESIHPKGPHATTLLVGRNAKRVFVDHNLFAHTNGRNPLVRDDVTDVMLVNNLLYNPGRLNGSRMDLGTSRNPLPMRVSVVGNQFIPGVDSGPSGFILYIDRDITPGSSVYVADNLTPTTTSDPWAVVRNNAGASVVATAPPYWSPGVVARPSAQLEAALLDDVGACPAHRDPVDARVISEVRAGTGSFVDTVDPGQRPEFFPVGIVQGATSTTLRLETKEYGRDDGFNNPYVLPWVVEILSGPGAGQERQIASYAGSTRTLTLTSPWSTLPVAGSSQYGIRHLLAAPLRAAPGGWPVLAENQRALTLPANPSGDDDADGYTNLEAWLHGYAADCEWRPPVACVTLGGVCCASGEVCTGAGLGGASDCPGRCCATSSACDQPTTVFSPVPYLGDRNNYVERDPTRWAVVYDQGDWRYGITTTAYDAEPGSRLGEYALISGRDYGDFTLSLRARSADDLVANASADYGLVYGFQDDANYAYLMINHNVGLSSLFHVVGGQRQLAAEIAGEVFSDNAYHDVTLTRAGDLIVFEFDGVERLRTTDTLFGAGGLGVGSFNDSVFFDDLEVVAPGGGDPVDGGSGDPDAGSSGDPDAGSSGDPDAGSSGDPDAGSSGDPDAGSSGDPDAGSSGDPDAGSGGGSDASDQTDLDGVGCACDGSGGNAGAYWALALLGATLGFWRPGSARRRPDPVN